MLVRKSALPGRSLPTLQESYSPLALPSSIRFGDFDVTLTDDSFRNYSKFKGILKNSSSRPMLFGSPLASQVAQESYSDHGLQDLEDLIDRCMAASDPSCNPPLTDHSNSSDYIRDLFEETNQVEIDTVHTENALIGARFAQVSNLNLLPEFLFCRISLIAFVALEAAPGD